MNTVTGVFLHIISSVIHRSHFIAEGSISLFQISFPLEEKYEIELLRSGIHQNLKIALCVILKQKYF